MYETLLTAVNIRRTEAEPAFLLLGLRFCMGCGFIIAETVALTLFLSRFDGTLFGFQDIAALPVVYVLGAATTMVIGLGFLTMQRFCPTGVLISGVLAGITAIIFAFWSGIQGNDNVFLYPALFIATEVTWILTALSAELTMNAVFNVRQAKRTLGVINGGETVAYIAGAYTVVLLVPIIGVEDVLLIAAGFILVSLLLYFHILRRFGGPLSQTAPGPKRRQSVAAYRSRFIWLLVVFTALTMFALYTTGFQARAAIRLSFDEEGIALCLGILEGTLGLARALLAFFVVNRVIARLGLFITAGFLPLAWLITALLVTLSPTSVAFAFIIASYGFDRVIRFSFGNATSPLFYHCLPENRKYQVQAFVSGVISPVGAALSGLVLLGFGDTLGGDIADLTLISWGLFAVGVAAIPIVILLRKDYLRLLLSLARGKRLNIAEEDRLDRESLQLLRERLSSDDPGDIIFAMGLLERVDKDGLIDALPGLLGHESGLVRMRAYQMVVALKDQARRPSIVEAIDPEQESDDARPDAVRALAAVLGPEAADRLTPFTGDPHPEPVRAAAVAALARWGDEAGDDIARPLLDDWSSDEDPPKRICALNVLMESGRDDLWSNYEDLLDDPEPSVRLRAVEAAGRLGIDAFHPAIVEALQDPSTAAGARWILSQMGQDALPALHHGLSKAADSPSLRPALVQLAARINHPDAQALLFDALQGDDVQARQMSLENLFQADNLTLTVPTADQLAWLDRERRFFVALARFAVVVDQRRDSPDAELLSDALNDALEDTLLRVLYQLRFGYPRELLKSVHTTWSHPGSRHVALEILDNVLRNPIRNGAMRLFDQRPTQEKIQSLAESPDDTDMEQVSLEHVVRTLCADHAYGDWIRICALNLAPGVMAADDAAGLARPLIESDNPILAEVAQAVAEGSSTTAPRPDTIPEKESSAMLSTLEKLLFLKKVDIFAAVRDEYLASLARSLTEQTIEEGEIVFREDDVGQSMYVIVSGSVHLEKNGERFATLGSGECVGELAVLDSEPRSATVVAAEDSLLLVIDGQDLFDIMAGQIEIARGLFKVITHRLREAREDAVEATRALEKASTKDAGDSAAPATA